MLIELNELLKLLVLLLLLRSVPANHLPLPSFPLPLPFQAAVLVSTVSLKLPLHVKKQVVRMMRVMKVMRVMRVRRVRVRVRRVVMGRMSNLTHQEVVLRPSLVLVMRSL